MPFQEKSAWVMSCALLATGAWYFATVISKSGDGLLAAPSLPVLAAYTILLTIFAIAGHIVIALFSIKDANAKTDERERRIFEKAGSISSNFFALGIIWSLILFIVTSSGNLLFYSVFGSLILRELLMYLLRIFFYRRPIA